MKRTLIVSAPNARIKNVLSHYILPDGTCKLVVEVEDPVLEIPVPMEQKQVEDNSAFVLIDSSKIKVEEYFVAYKPSSYYGMAFRENFIKLLEENENIKFYASIYAPSIKDGIIQFVKGAKPGVGYSFEWWKIAAKDFKPQHNSRLGFRKEYIVYVAFLINLFIENGWTVEDSWNACCNDSKSIGKFLTRGPSMDNTGSQEIFGFYDLGNVRRLVQSERSADYCWIAGGSYKTASFINPLANFDYHRIDAFPYEDAVGWVIYDA